MKPEMKEFLNKLCDLMEEYDAEFEVYTEFLSYDNCGAVFDIEMGDPKKGTYLYEEVPLRFIEPESIREWMNESF